MTDPSRWEIIERGAGPSVLVALPGAMGTAGVFDAVLSEFASWRTIAASPPAVPDVEALAEGLIAELAARGVVRATLLGTSFGGYLAQFVAARVPQLIDRLVLANTFADPTRNPNRRTPEAVAAEDAEQMHASAVERVSGGPDSPTRTALLVQLGFQAPATLKARALALARGGPVPLLALDAGRIGLIDTADDPVISPALRADLSERYPGARHIRLPTGGHYPYLADPAGYAAAVLALAAGD